jgi:MarR family transcriptional regulator for hemolysin
VDLDRSFGFLVNDVARLFGRRFTQNGKRLGLTRAQCRTIGYLARNEGINQAGLADLLEIRPMTLVRQIDRMEDAGWIERRPDPNDRRARRLYLTGKARPILGRILRWRTKPPTRR